VTDLLSQEEIDALLRGGGGGGGDSGEAPPADAGAPPAASGGDEAKPPTGGGSGKTVSMSQEDIDQLSEVAKLSLGATSSVVQMLLNKPVELNLSQLRVVHYDTLAAECGAEDYIIAKIAYIEGFDGNTYLLLRKNIAAVIGNLMMMGGEGQNPEFQEMHKSAVGEMLNQMMGKTTTSLSEIFKKRVDIAPPHVELVNFSQGMPAMPDFHPDAGFLRIGFQLKIGDIAETEMIQLLAIEFAQLMASQLAKPAKPEPKKVPPPPPPPPGPPGLGAPAPGMPGAPGPMPGMPMPGGIPGMGMPGMPGAMPGMPGAMPGMPGAIPGMPGAMPGIPGAMPGMPSAMPGMPGMGMPGMGMPGMPMQGNPAEFGMLQMPMGMGLQSNIDLLLDVPLQITVELGRTRMLIKNVLELGIGSVVELNKLAGEAVEVFVNNKLIAKGEVVVIDENFAVRITSIVNPQDRLQAL
jgi:flagellar motor switch protein FliN/FliY